ncbi:MAG TPA: FAD-linked oxidase C-terminal domain-containing protein [Thermoplasmata archaeon]|nr:FAD-linked oxidase C-terminal domain-containing protein [Thermoplasmata archaeon]
MESRAIKWWGWGWEDNTVPLETRPALVDYRRGRLKLDMSIGEDGVVVLRTLQRELDPDGIMNPGTLVAGPP